MSRPLVMTLDQHFTPTAGLCPSCATPLAQHARFCPACGEPCPVAEATGAPAPTLAETATDADADADSTVANPTYEHAFTPSTENDIDQLMSNEPHQRDLRSLAAIGIAVVVAILVLVQLAHGGSYAPAIAGQKIAKPATVLKQGEAVMHDTVAAQHGNIDANSRCYFATLPASHDVLSSLECGPVYFPDSTSSTYWMTVNFTLDPNGVATVSNDATTNQTLAPGEKLARPDGKHQPAKPAITIPEPAAQASGFQKILQLQDARGLSFTTPPDGRFIGPDYNLDVTGVTQTTKIGQGKDALIAANGEHFVVARIETVTDGSTTSSNSDGSAISSDAGSTGPQAVLVVDDTRINFTDKQTDFTDFGTFAANGGMYVISVAQTAQAVSLEVADHGRAQTISLLTGARAADAIATYYRKTSSQDLGFPQHSEIAVAVPLMLQESRGGSQEKFAVDAYVQQASLTPWTPNDGYAPPGYTWLDVQYKSWVTSGVDTGYFADNFLTTKSFWVTVDGKRIYAQAVGANNNKGSAVSDDGRGGIQVQDGFFKVPDTITTATFTARPTLLFEYSFVYPKPTPTSLLQMPAMKPIALDFGSPAAAK